MRLLLAASAPAGKGVEWQDASHGERGEKTALLPSSSPPVLSASFRHLLIPVHRFPDVGACTENGVWMEQTPKAIVNTPRQLPVARNEAEIRRANLAGRFNIEEKKTTRRAAQESAISLPLFSSHVRSLPPAIAAL